MTKFLKRTLVVCSIALGAALGFGLVALGPSGLMAAGGDLLRRPRLINGELTFPNVEQINNDTDGSLVFQGVGGTNDASAEWDLDNAAGPILSSASDTAILIDEDLTFVGPQTIATDSGALTIAPAAGFVFSVDATTGLDIQNSATGDVILSWRDYADTTDDDMVHASAVANCTATGTGAEDCDLTFSIVEAGAAAEARLFLDADGDIVVGGANGQGVRALVDATVGLEVRNNATGSVLHSYRDYADTTDDDMAHAQVTVNCTDTGTGTEDCDYTIGVVEGGAAAETRFEIDGDGAVALGSANTTVTMTDGTLTTTVGGAGDFTEAGLVDFNMTGTGDVDVTGGTSAQFGDDTATIDFDGAGAVTETGMTTFVVSASGAVTMTGGAASAYGDTTGTLDFDGSGAVAETGMTTFALTPSGAITLTGNGGTAGDGAVVLTENSIGPDEVAVMVESVIFCGDLESTGTNYYAPVNDVFAGDFGNSSDADYTISGTLCSALDNTTETTADAPLTGLLNVAFKVLGMRCYTSGEPTADVVFTARSAAADLTPSVTCTVASAGTTDSCSTVTGSTTDVAAGATVAVKTVTGADESSRDGWCKVFIAFK